MIIENVIVPIIFVIALVGSALVAYCDEEK